jgi:hypothetical protein
MSSATVDEAKLQADIAAIVKESRPGCNQKRECWTQCDECGAQRVMALLKERGVLE